MYLPQLNFTRFLAAIAIVIYHFGRYSYPFNFPETKYLMANLDTLVSYFFILSGFVMILANTKKGLTAISISNKVFWINRLARLYPLYLFALLFFVAVYGISKIDLTPFLLNLTLTQAWIPDYALSLNTAGWALSVEIFFYACFPFILPILTRLNNKQHIALSLFLWIVSLLAMHYLIDIKAPKGFIYFFPLIHLSNFVIGLCAGLLLARNFSQLQKYNRAFGLSFLFLSIGALYLLLTNSLLLKYQHNGSMAPVYLSLLFFLSLGSGSWVKLLSHPVIIYLGEISFAIYIIQVPVYILFRDYIVSHFHFTMTQGFYVYLAIVLATAILCYEFIEKKARNYIKNKL